MLSLLGTGVVLFCADFRNRGFFTVPVGFGVDLLLFADPLGCKTPSFVLVEVDGVGVEAGFFEKKPRIDAWFLVEATLELCFFNVGVERAGVVSSLFLFLAILTKLCFKVRMKI
jgi:hypothetical protein